MKEIYRVEGALNQGFVGQIAYTVCLEGSHRKLDIEFSFDPDKRVYSESDVTPELIAETMDVCGREYGIAGTEEEARRVILGDMKTEIHTLAELNGEFIGCVHKQLTNRHMTYDGDFASEGCIPRDAFEGVLRVTILVFNVIKDDTRYALTVRAD